MYRADGMARDINKGSEFGGVEGLVQPPPHVPTAAERLSLLYRTGDPSGQTPPRLGVFAGLREEAAQRAAREAEGALAKGQVADELLTLSEAEIAALQAEAAPD